MLVTDRGQTLRTKVSEIRETGRNAQGVRVMSVDEGERVVAIEALAEADDGGALSVGPEGGPTPSGMAPGSNGSSSDGNGSGSNDGVN
jgi:DNA gyrase subunit A